MFECRYAGRASSCDISACHLAVTSGLGLEHTALLLLSHAIKCVKRGLRAQRAAGQDGAAPPKTPQNIDLEHITPVIQEKKPYQATSHLMRRRIFDR